MEGVEREDYCRTIFVVSHVQEYFTYLLVMRMFSEFNASLYIWRSELNCIFCLLNATYLIPSYNCFHPFFRVNPHSYILFRMSIYFVHLHHDMLWQEEGVNITANSLHPGAIPTNLIRYHPIVEGKPLWLFPIILKLRF